MNDHIAELKQKFESGDLFPKSLGIELVELEPGRAVVAMTVTESMANFHGTAHGGALFTLADTAFALSCNSHGTPAVALSVTMDYMAPARPGDRLVAVAEEAQRTKRTGSYHITVTANGETKIAFFRGLAFIKA
ncbi:MAG TPA: hydroxyphenylacetyl-CoA thioesterase PaaI [Spirochaetota bacterium]|nr:hydroxyphenylacetyl-CoA thioesterase PaaI [Spirochaetota bacterium]